MTLASAHSSQKANPDKVIRRSTCLQSLVILVLLVFELCCEKTDRQTGGTEHATHAQLRRPAFVVFQFFGGDAAEEQHLALLLHLLDETGLRLACV